jgi:hypothetical protein
MSSVLSWASGTAYRCTDEARHGALFGARHSSWWRAALAGLTDAP